jgi:signal transduction histidine kinase/ligand-binding sensor domain-containing protein
MQLKVFSVFFIVYVCLSSVIAQPSKRFWHLTTADGLSGYSVKSIAQDDKGFMWFGTESGLNRYDAKSFRLIKKSKVGTNGLSGNKIKKLVLFKKQLWAITDGGLSIIDPQSLQAKSFKITLEKKVINNINDIYFEDDNTCWIGTPSDGWGKLNIHTHQYTRNDFNNSQNDTSILNKIYNALVVTGDKDNHLYIGSLAFSLIVDSAGQNKLTYKRNTKYPFPAHTVNTIYCDASNTVWLGCWDNALHRYDKTQNKIETIFLTKNGIIDYSGDEITCINEDNSGNLWIGTSKNGLYLYNLKSKVFTNLNYDQYRNNSISDNHINCIFRDKENRMWIGTNRGLDIYDPLLNQLQVNYLSKNKNNPGMINDFVRSGERLYIGGQEGLWINPFKSDSTFMSYQFNGETLNITSLFKGSNDIVYVGSNRTSFILDKNTNSLSTFSTVYNRQANSAFDFYDIAASRIVGMAQSKDFNTDLLWVSPYGHGIAAFNMRNHVGFVSSLFEGQLRMEHLINKIYCDSKNNIFFLTANNGIGAGFNSRSGIDSLLSLPLTSAKSVLTNYDPLLTTFLNHKIPTLPNDIFDMLEDKDGGYWITSPTSGLYYITLSLKENKIKHYIEEFPNLYGLHKDNNGNLWIITSGGIIFFDVKTKMHHLIGSLDGIPIQGLHRYFYKDVDGMLYAGGKGYYVSFNPEKYQFNANKPNSVLTHFTIFDKNNDSLLISNTIGLSYKQNYFSFEFSSLNYTIPSANRFAYKLEGVDDKWIESGSRNYASYTNLEGGNYVFKVRSANNNNVWGDAKSININITPPIWQYSWFWPMTTILIGAIFFVMYKRRITALHNIQTQKLVAEIDAQEKERRRIARDLHDEFGTKMSALKIYLSTFEKFIDYSSDEAKRTRNELYHIVDNSMQDLRSLLMDLSPKTLEMHGFSAALQDLSNRLSQTLLFTISCFVAPELEKFEKKYELTLFRIIQELINNSIKHSNCTEINIQLFYRDNTIVLNYDDNGKGFDTATTAISGYGLKNIETRTTILNGSIIWESSPGKGINALITIPYKTAIQ